MPSFRSAISLSSCTFIKRLLSSFLLSALRVVSSAYLRLLMFLLVILTPPYASSRLAFCMTYSAYKLDSSMTIHNLTYSSPNYEPVHCSMSGSHCCFLTCIQEIGEVVWYSHLFKNFPQFVVIHTAKGFSKVNEAEIDVFWNSLAFSMIQEMLAI